MAQPNLVQDTQSKQGDTVSSNSVVGSVWRKLNTPLAELCFGTKESGAEKDVVHAEKIFQEVLRVQPDRVASAKEFTSRVWRENKLATIAYFFVAFQENAGFAVMNGLVTWTVGSLDSQNPGKAFIPIAFLAAYGIARYAVNSLRHYISESFESAANRVINTEVTQGVLSRALSTIRSPGYQSLYGSVQENSSRVLAFIKTNFAMVGSIGGIVISSFVVGVQDIRVASALILVGVLEVYHSLRSNKAYLRYEVESANERAELRAQRGFAKSIQGVREFLNLLKVNESIDKASMLDKEVERKALKNALRHSLGSIAIGIFPLAIEVAAIGNYLFDYLAFGVGNADKMAGLVFGILSLEWSMIILFRTIGNQITNGTFAGNALALSRVGKPRYVATHEAPSERLDVSSTPRIDMRNVSYTPEGEVRPVLHGITCAFLPGRVYGLCGDSGSGKTSLLRLLTLEHEATGGEILFSKKRIGSVSPDDICKVVGYLPQDYLDLETYSIKDAVELGGRQGETTISLDQAAGSAQVTFAGDVSTFGEKRIGTAVKGGRPFSGGERHRIAMARVLFKDSRVLILDEPTSSLGILTERAILRSVKELAKERGLTVIIVSHRYSNLKNADRILFFDNGKIVERGSHKKLMALGGRYATRYTLEREGYED